MNGRKKESLRETDLYEPVRDWLTGAGWQVRGEVKGCDVAAVDGERLILVELKTALNFEVVLQAVERQKTGDLVYVAIPAKVRAMAGNRWKMATHLLRRLEIGLLLVHGLHRAAQTSQAGDDAADLHTGKSDAMPSGRRDGERSATRCRVEELIPPVPFDRAQSRSAAKRKREALMKEFHARSGDHNRGGSVKRPLVTAYREEALFLARCLSERGPSMPGTLRLMGADARKTTGILRNNHYGWFESISRGVYGLTEKGKAALTEYGTVAESAGRVIQEVAAKPKRKAATRSRATGSLSKQ